MTISLTYLGHSGVIISDTKATLAVDPFLTGNPKAPYGPEKVTCDTIALTHGHADHCSDTPAIAKRNDAVVIAPYEVTEYLGAQGLTKLEPGNPGGRITTPFGWVAFTHAIHSSSFEGQYMGAACGLMINIGGVTIYHLGDTDIFSDMKLIGEIYKPDIALVPIGDRFTMGPALATKAAEMIKPKVAIPVHYNTWPPIEQDPKHFAPKGIEVKIMEPGETWSYG